MNELYRKLAKHLDGLPGGFPATPSGVEIRILKRLFTPDEARVAMALTMFPETVEATAAKLKMHSGTLEPLLRQMARKGLIFRKTKAGKAQYMAAQFVIGIWEYHVNSLDEGLIRDFNEYVPFIADQWYRQKTKQLRVIPIAKSFSAEMQIMPYEKAEQIIKLQTKIVVTPCICRKEHEMVAKGCGNPLEVCLSFGSGAYYYEENGLGRAISIEEALGILQKGAEAGLVLQPGNAQNPMNICMCCGCCCQVLKNLNTLSQPARAVNSSYQAHVDASRCLNCGICRDRCHMHAITCDDTAMVDLDRCIGCGVCITKCEAGALRLIPKPLHERWIPPATVFDTYLNIAKERGLV